MTQLPNVVSLIPRSRAIFATVLSLALTSSTACSRTLVSTCSHVPSRTPFSGVTLNMKVSTESGQLHLAWLRFAGAARELAKGPGPPDRAPRRS
jgi:hypothetical protein